MVTVGQRTQRELSVTQAMVDSYAEITGDYNPLHFDEEFARKTRFGGLIAQGGITTGLLHALVAMDIPGPGSVFLSQSWSFPNPVYIGDTIRAVATVTSYSERRGIAKMEFEVKNQRGEDVLKGEATVMRFAPEQ